MASYLLLRDNKESGPFGIDDLLKTGLKPYDLIWVQGKSAAWRYPSEIEELKSFAPAIEEQPYDRFYKKNREEEKKEDPQVSQEQFNRYAPPATQEEPHAAYIPKKSVFVTMPGQKQAGAKKDPVPAPAPPPVPTRTIPEPTISITENPAAAEMEVKYSQPLDEIKEMYVKTLLERKDKKAKKGLLVNSFKKAAVFGGLLVVGIAAGFIIRSKSADGDKKKRELQDMSQVSTSSFINNNANSETDSGNQDEQVYRPDQEEVVQNKVVKNNEHRQQPEMAKNDEMPRTLKIRKETMLIVPQRKENYDRQSTPGAEINSLTGERERKLRKNDTAEFSFTENTPAKKSLKDLVSVASNDYKRVAFGGIRNLYLTVTNNSKYELDNVIVELQYLKPSEEPLRTENIHFKSVAPHGTATLRVPDTNRGIKVSYRIITIDSRQNDVASGK